MISRTLQQALVIALLLFASQIGVVAAELYRWVDDEGNIHYSDQIPPAAANRPRAELNTLGQATRELNISRSREQLIEERERLLDEQRRSRQRERQLAEDRALLTTFSSVAELEALYANRLRDIDNYTNANHRKLAKTKTLLEKTRERKQWYLARDKKVPKQVVDNIEEYQQQIATYELLIERNLAKRQKLEEKFKKDKQRFITLTGDAADQSQ